jgi:4,4'-diaponeurosporenoate glycosyltransferase
MALLLILTAATWLLGFLFLWRVDRPTERSRSASRQPSLSIIVPARDEASNLPGLLSSIRNQGRLDVEIIVADDGSRDGTSEIARREGVIALAVPPKPPGWTGKTWACWNGANAASGELLIFLDADTRVEPSGLDKLVETQLDTGGLVSLEPYHRVQRPYEQLSAFFNIVRTASVGVFGLFRGDRGAAGAFGPCIAVSRDDYFAVGGHADPSVRGQILENFNLGKRLRDSGRQLTCLGGRGALSSRMYPDGLAELAAGWGKAFSSGARGTPPGILLTVIAWISGAAAAASGLIVAPLVESTAFTGSFGVLYLAYCIQIYWMMRQTGTFSPLTAALYVVPLAAFFVIFLHALARSLLGGEVRWRGRTIRSARGG